MPSLKHWENIKTYFDFDEDVRRIIYTTNAVESVHRQFRKVTKNRSVFPNDESLFKLLYLSIGDIPKKIQKLGAGAPIGLNLSLTLLRNS